MINGIGVPPNMAYLKPELELDTFFFFFDERMIKIDAAGVILRSLDEYESLDMSPNALLRNAPHKRWANNVIRRI